MKIICFDDGSNVRLEDRCSFVDDVALLDGLLAGVLLAVELERLR